MLRGAAPVNGRAVRSTAARVETVSAKEPGSSRAEAEVGIKVFSSLPRRLTFQLTRRLTFQLTRSPSQHECSDSLSTPDHEPFDPLSTQPTNPPTFSALQTMNPPTLLALNQRTLRLSQHNTEDGVLIYRLPSAGRGLGEADVTVRLDWTELPLVRPFWAGFGQTGKPAHSTRADSPKRNYCKRILLRTASRRLGE